MNPIYKFELATEYNGVTNNYAVYPLRKADLAKDYELQQNEKFYRAKLSGKLLFVRADYAIIANARFETKFTLVISISWNNGQTWAEYWRGVFWKTDCSFDMDAQTVEVTPAPVDQYTDVLAGLEKEYNLINLKPEIEHISAWKRPLIQIYIPGESVVSCFLSGMYWEQDCAIVSEDDVIEIDGQEYPALTHKYYYSLIASRNVYDVVGSVDVSIDTLNPSGYSFEIYDEPTSVGTYWYAELIRQSDGARWVYNAGMVEPTLPLTLLADTNTPATGSVEVSKRTIKVYGRYLTDVNRVGTYDTYLLPYDDMVENNRNYKRAIGYADSNTIAFSTNVSDTPTEWGIIEPGVYYSEPDSTYGNKYFPIGRSHWAYCFSIWFTFSAADLILEQRGRKQFTMKDTYPLHSVISALLGQIAPGITHEPTTEYSQFLYDVTNPISGDNFHLFITQKSNVLAGEYTQPAQKALVTLKMVTDMLRDVYRAYWYIEDGKFKIEHIQWFKNGGRYTGTPVISHDLTVETVTRNGKAWAFGTSQYEYDKPTMPERYQFGWMDDVTNVFNGLPIDILSKYVMPGNIEEINVSNFTSDIDYMLLNPGACSKDGFALMAAIQTDGGYRLPFITQNIDGVQYTNQNGLLAFMNLQPKYYIYDLPAYNIRINNEQSVAYGITREKKQTLRLPVVDDPNPTQLIKTYLGNGQVEKISVNLSSRNANVTLMYDTQNPNE